MKTSSLFKTVRPFLFALTVVVSGFPVARAELVADEPPVVMATISGATSSTVTVKLGDGRTTKKIPRKVFPRNTDFYPGRIVALKLTDEIRAAIAPNAKPRDLTDAELVRIIETYQRMGGKGKIGKGRKHTAFDWLPVTSAYAADKCAPIRDSGKLLTADSKEGACKYDAGWKCESRTEADAAKEANKSFTGDIEVGGCNPLIYGMGKDGAGLCIATAAKTAGTCTERFNAMCDAIKKDDPTKFPSGYRDCIREMVLPYVKEHAKEFEALANRIADICDEKTEIGKVADRSAYCTEGKVSYLSVMTVKTAIGEEQKLIRKKNRENERSTTRCTPVKEDNLNFDLTTVNADTNQAVFTTISGPACNGARLCVRQVKCAGEDGEPETLRFARCRAENCHSVIECLKDPMAGGTSAKSAITPPAASSGEGN